MKGSSVTRIADVLMMDRTTLTRNLNPLQQLGYIETSAASDRRSRALQITRKGEEVLNVAVPLWKEAQKQVDKTLGKVERIELHKALERSIDLLEVRRGA
jgi:DNA-binding MarR family transcriptional regulator